VFPLPTPLMRMKAYDPSKAGDSNPILTKLNLRPVEV
jgi:hypothetical protein